MYKETIWINARNAEKSLCRIDVDCVGLHFPENFSIQRLVKITMKYKNEINGEV